MKFKKICLYALNISVISIAVGIALTGCASSDERIDPIELIDPIDPNGYYVSSSLGDDENPGTKSQPWKTLGKITETTFEAGESIYLMSGDVFEGTLTLNGKGTPDNPVTLASYGEGERPFVKGPGDDESVGVTIPASSQGWRIIGIEIAFAREGIQIISPTTSRYFYFEDLYIHDINNSKWETHIDWGSGIHLTGGGSVEGITVKNCIFRGNDVDFFPQEYPSERAQCTGFKDVAIDGCTFMEGLYNSVYQRPGTGTTGENFDILNCMFYKNGAGVSPYGTGSVIAGFLSGGVVSGNEFAFQQDSYGNDGCAYDFEFTAENITFRDNFIYDCYGEAILFMPGVNGNVIMRENIVIEDNLFINNCAGSKVHRSEISFILKDGYDGDITIRNNRFMLVPKIRTIFPVPKCIIDENNMEIADAIIETPEYIFDAASKTIAFSCADPDAVLYFTTDGSVPTQKSEKYTGQKIEITKTTVVNCKAYKSGYLPSRACVALVSPN